MELSGKIVEAQLSAWGIEPYPLELKRKTAVGGPRRVLIAETDPQRTIAALLGAMLEDCHIFLTNPNWGEERVSEAYDLIKPDFVIGMCADDFLGSEEKSIDNNSSVRTSSLPGPIIMIPTGGTMGQLRFAIHSWKTLSNAAEKFLCYFEEEEYNSCCFLPLYHVSGLMQVIRAMHSGGSLTFADPANVALGQFPNIDPGRYFTSLVPTLLMRFLENEKTTKWLRGFKAVLLGGGASSRDLITKARANKIPVAPCYGLTETAANMIALKPEQFLAGVDGVGYPFKPDSVFIRDDAGLPLAQGQTGSVILYSNTLALGYYPDQLISAEAGFATRDAGYIDANGSLHLVGRLDHVINSGGEKIYPERLQRMILGTGMVDDVFVTRKADVEWGEIPIAYIVPSRNFEDLSILEGALRPIIATYEMPKKWITREQLPRNLVGKIDISRL